MSKLKEFLKYKSFALPYSEKDLIEAYELGVITLLIELQDKIVGYPVNGLVRGVILEEEIIDRIKKLEEKDS